MAKKLKIDTSSLTSTDSSNTMHSDMYKTLDLLRLYDRDSGSVYFITEGLASLILSGYSHPLDKSYWFDEHTCPTNYIRIEAVMTAGSSDPHGIFDYIRSVWMPAGYEELDDCDGSKAEKLLELFPEIKENMKGLKNE